MLVVKDGLIADFGPYAEVSKRHANLTVTHLKNRLILPGFIDGHIHFPQVRVLESSWGSMTEIDSSGQLGNLEGFH